MDEEMRKKVLDYQGECCALLAELTDKSIELRAKDHTIIFSVLGMAFAAGNNKLIGEIAQFLFPYGVEGIDKYIDLVKPGKDRLN